MRGKHLFLPIFLSILLTVFVSAQDLSHSTTYNGAAVTIKDYHDNGDGTHTPLMYTSGIGSQVGQLRARVSSVTLTRPNDTTAYAANDGVTNSTSAPTNLEFTSSAGTAGGTGIIYYARLVKSTNVTTNATFRLWLYNAAPSNTPNDNAAFSQAWANAAKRLGYIDFAIPLAGTDCVGYEGVLSQRNIAFDLVSGTSLYGILQVTGAYTPGAQEQFQFLVGVLSE